MNVTSKMEIELEVIENRGKASQNGFDLIHGDNLTITATCRTTFDAKSRSLTGLSNARKGRTAKFCTKSLGKANSCR